MSRQVKVSGQLQEGNQAQVVRTYLNRSGDTLAAGDVVVLDTTNSTDTELYVTTTTSQDSADVAGMVLEACAAANGTPVKILVDGPTALLKVDGTTDIARGAKLSTFTTAKIAAVASSGSNGVFATALEAYATDDSNGVIDAYVHVGRANVAAASGNTLDQSYDQGGAGLGRTITADTGAVVIQNTDADTTNILEINKSPSAGAAGDGIDITMGANATGVGIDINNSGSGSDIDGTSSTWSVSKAGVAAFATINAADINSAASGNTALTIDAAGTGTITVGGTSTGAITLGRATTLSAGATITTGGLTVSAGGITSAGDETHTVAATTGNGILIDGSTVTTGNVVRIEYDATLAAGGFGALSITEDGSEVFVIAEDGNVTIAGTASGTAAITLTAGDLTITSGNATMTLGNLTMTDGDLDMNEGKLTIDTTTNESSYIKRNQAITTTPVLEIEETNTAADNPCLLIDHNPTGDINAVEVAHDGTGFGLSVTAANAAGRGVEIIGAANATATLLLVDGTTGNWVGGATTGMVALASDGALVADAALLRIASSGNIAAANDGACLEILETGAAQATSYAVKIDSTSNEALHVATGKMLVDEQATFTLGMVIGDNGPLGIGAASGESTLQSDGTNTLWTVVSGNIQIGTPGSNSLNIASSGALTFSGTARPTKTLWFDANDFSVVAGSAAMGTVGAGSARGYAFDAAADEAVTLNFRVPDNWVAGSDVTAYIYWCANAVAGDCVWDLITVPLAESEAMAGAGNTDSVTDTTDGTANDLNITAAVTISASTEWAAGDLVVLKVNRNADDAADTLAADAVLLGVRIDYTAGSV